MISKEKNSVDKLLLREPASRLSSVKDKQVRRKRIIEKIKLAIVRKLNCRNADPNTCFSKYLSKELKYNYTYLANVFSESESITIEHFILMHKIEMVKKLIAKDKLTLTEIASKLNYSSVAHLSNQFKKISGITATKFREALSMNAAFNYQK